MTFQKTIESVIQNVGLIELNQPSCASKHQLSDLHTSFAIEAAKRYEQYGIKPKLLLSFDVTGQLHYAALMPMPDRYIDCLGIHNLTHILNRLGNSSHIERHSTSSILRLHENRLSKDCLMLGPELIAKTIESLQRIVDQGDGEEAWTSR